MVQSAALHLQEIPSSLSSIGALDTLGDRVAAASAAPRLRVGGVVSEVASSYCCIKGLSHALKLGECVEIVDGKNSYLAEAVRVEEGQITVKPFESIDKMGLSASAWLKGTLSLAPDRSWKGRILNALGDPVDGEGAVSQGSVIYAIDREPPSPMFRQRLRQPIRTGVMAIDIFTPLCFGQRIGIFAGSGVGKSTLLAMLAGASGFDTVVVALVGERGREVREFLEDVLGKDRKKTVAVVSAGNETPMMRRLAPRTAMSVAEYFRDRGDNVLLIVDSITRYAHAAREVALAAGEPPVARGYPPSVFTDLPKLLERAGPGVEGTGSITGIFSVLVDGDDHNEPVSDITRGIVDGHIVLDRSIADLGRYPAINVLSSISRLAQLAWTPDQRKLVIALKGLIARFEETRDLRLMGGYQAGSDGELDKAIGLVPRVYDALKQSPGDHKAIDAFNELNRALKA